MPSRVTCTLKLTGVYAIDRTDPTHALKRVQERWASSRQDYAAWPIVANQVGTYRANTLAINISRGQPKPEAE